MLRDSMINGNVTWLVSREATQCIHRSFYYRAMTIVAEKQLSVYTAVFIIGR